MAYAERTFLPFLRRAARTLRPFFELMRARKPWTLLRLRVFGWNVRFMFEDTSYFNDYVSHNSLDKYIRQLKQCQTVIPVVNLFFKKSFPISRDLLNKRYPHIAP